MARKLMPYERAGRSFVVLGWFFLTITIIITILVSLMIPAMLAVKQSPDRVAAGEQPVDIVEPIVILLVLFGVSIFQMYLGKAIKAHKEWSRMVGIILAFLALFAFPIGTLIGGYILWWLIGGWSIPDNLGVEPVEPSPAPDASSR